MNQLSYSEQVALRMIPGAYKMIGFGERTTSGAETNINLWPGSTAYTIPAEGGLEMSVVSTSANDASAGTGIRWVEIHYLDEDYQPKNIFVELNGLTPVTITGISMSFIQCMHGIAMGSGKVAAGDITLENGGTVYAIILTGKERCASAFRMVPAGKQLRLEFAIGSSISGTSAARTQLSLISTQVDENQSTYAKQIPYPSEAPLFLPQMSIGVQDGNAQALFPALPAYKEKTIIGMRHTSDKATTISGTWIAIVEGARIEY